MAAADARSAARTARPERRAAPPVDLDRARAAVRELLLAIGEDPDREGLRETPDRVARAAVEMYAGLRADPAEVLATSFDIGHDEIVAVRDIPVSSVCEHHLLPFTGVAHAARTTTSAVRGGMRDEIGRAHV